MAAVKHQKNGCSINPEAPEKNGKCLSPLAVRAGLINGMQLLGVAEVSHNPWSTACWEAMLRKEFPHHTRDVARLNNGSFGCCPSSVLLSQASFQRQWLEQPDEFYFGPLEKGLQASRAAVARLIGSGSPEQIVLVDNSTTAAAMIAQQISWGFVEHNYRPGDAILMLTCSYAAVKTCFRAYAVRAGARIIEVDIHLPIQSSQQIIDSFRATLDREKSSRIILAVIDHITSMPSIVLPVKQLVAMCRAASVERVFVDGAHSAGNICFSVDEIGADFYCSNLHKWCFTPSSAAFLHIKAGSGAEQDLHHPIVSHNYSRGAWSECSWVGTRDYSAQLAVASALDFMERRLGGVEILSALNRARAFEMAAMLADAWGTGMGTCAEVSSAMVMVELPGKLGVQSEEGALELRSKLRSDFGVEVPVLFQPNPAGAYARVSHQVYNRREDYIRFKDAVLELCGL